MKICFISPCDLTKDNGGKTHTVELARNWLACGHNVFLFSKWGQKLRLQDLRHIQVPYISVKGFNELSFSLFSLILVIIFHLRYKFDVIYERKTMTCLGVLVGKLFKVPVIIELNDIHFSMAIDRIILEEDNNWKRVLLKILRPILHIDVTLATKLCTKIITTAQLKLPHIKEEETISIPFGANTALFRPLNTMKCRQKLNYPSKNKIICFVGSFYPWQGVEYIIEAMFLIVRELPDALLIVIGDQEPKMQESRKVKENILISAKSLILSNNILFPGRIPYEKVPLYINASDVCVIAQRPMRAGFTPLKLLEYMACSKPVVASDIEGVCEIIIESGGGLLVDPENPEKLAESIVKLLKDEDLMKKMGENGLECVLEKYNWENVAREAMKVCEDAVEKKRAYK